MSIVLLRAIGPGTRSEWNPFGAPTNWQAAAQADGAFTYGSASGTRDRYVFEQLPPDTTAVASVVAWAACAGDDAASRLRLTLGLGGVEASGAPFSPPDGGYVLFSAAFATAPGGLPWTPPRVNALEGGPDIVDTTLDLFRVDEVYLFADVTSESVEARPRRKVVMPVHRAPLIAPGARQALAAPGGGRVAVPAPGGRRDVVMPVGRVRIPAGPDAAG